MVVQQARVAQVPQGDAPAATNLAAGELVAGRMRNVFIHIEPSDTLLQAAQLMELARIRHLPVLERGSLVGILSHRDVVEYGVPPLDGSSPVSRREHLRRIPVSRVMHTLVHTIGPEATLAEAAAAMLRYRIACLPVVMPGDAESRMIGLITESDLLAAAYVPRFDPHDLAGPRRPGRPA